MVFIESASGRSWVSFAAPFAIFGPSRSSLLVAVTCLWIQFPGLLLTFSSLRYNCELSLLEIHAPDGVGSDRAAHLSAA